MNKHNFKVKIKEKIDKEKLQSRYIDANKLIEYISAGRLRSPSELCFSETDIINIINNQPTANVAEFPCNIGDKFYVFEPFLWMPEEHNCYGFYYDGSEIRLMEREPIVPHGFSLKREAAFTPEEAEAKYKGNK